MDSKQHTIIALMGGLLIAASLVWVVSMLNPVDKASAKGSTRLLLPFVTKKWNTGPGTVIGKVVDAQTNLPPKYGSARVCYESLCTTANANGEYVLAGVPYGQRELNASADYYFPIGSTVNVIGGGTAMLNFAIYPSVSGGTHGMQVVLTWRSEQLWPGQGCKDITPFPPDPSGNCPNDLDTQLWVIPTDTSRLSYHIYPRNKGDCSQFPSACLDLDARYGSGPETLTIESYEDALYSYAVQNVWQYLNTIPYINETQARVQVYKLENGVPSRVLDRSVPILGGSLDLEAWLVFTLDGSTGDLVEKNCLTPIWTDELVPPTCP